MILESLIPTAVYGVIHYLLRRNETTREFIVKASRAVFSRVIGYGGDKVDTHRAYRALFDSTMRMTGKEPGRTMVGLSDEIFEELWELAQREQFERDVAALLKAGKRAEKFGKALASGGPLPKPVAP